ncbi:SDR family oxidoreductase [Empedobacter falsenii]|uniref:NAD(P)-dependent oxidoreductase n=1 Tax=Empedobacter falsenii TaxID=343874 RepID=UPI00257776DD|nr:SDR family oxidoreductase [Empedobacter falsenii]MDM1299662.1 SDR family oxidoreductase [Empedobacter falsenii]MDM1319455.1 SDR family oxidoreductase [Empedobacter falsenii]
MKIIVFGATGSVGKKIVNQALEKGYSVTAFVRNPEKLTSKNHPNLNIFQGDVLNLADVKEAVKNQDVVLCALGDGKIGKIRAEGTKQIITALKDSTTNRFICQSTIGAGNSYTNLNFIWKYVMFGFLLKKVLPDHNLQEKYIMESDLDYTIVRPSALTDGEISTNYQENFDETVKKLSLKISRPDVANFMIQQIDSKKYLKKAVSISN